MLIGQRCLLCVVRGSMFGPYKNAGTIDDSNGPSHLKSTPPLWKILEFEPKSSCSVIPDPNNYQKITFSDPDKISMEKGMEKHF